MPVYRTLVRTTHPILGGTGVNTFHFRTPGADPILPTEAFLQDATDALETFYGYVVGSLCPSGTTVSTDGVWTMLGEDPQIVDEDGWSISATGSTNPLPPALSMCLTWRTSIASRSGRGRTFLNPLRTTIVQTNGTPTEAARTGLVNAGNALIAQFAPVTNGAFVVYSPTQNISRDLVGCSISNEFAVLRSRRD